MWEKPDVPRENHANTELRFEPQNCDTDVTNTILSTFIILYCTLGKRKVVNSVCHILFHFAWYVCGFN